ncbi:MAG: sulfatase [Verrucomicrobiota bacterium]
MKPRYSLLLAALCTFPLLGETAEQPPNIVIILADDLGWNALGCYGSELVRTPHLDRLAAEGMRFTDAYALSQCLPTRAAMFSGQYGARTGLTSVETASPDYAPMISPGRPMALSPDFYTLFEMLRDAGYTTGMSGKMHLGGNPRNTRTAFAKSGITAFRNYGFSWIGPASPNREDKYVTAITDDMIQFIEQQQQEPFVAYLAHHSPHTPFDVPQAATERALDRGFKRSSDPDGVFSERVAAEYIAMIEYLDASVGRVMDKLDKLKIADHTLVLFLSDNGGLTRVWRNDPLRGGKGQLYEGGVRVPFIIRWPSQVPAGTVCSTPVHVVDLFPTFMELADGEMMQDQILDGASIVPLLTQSGDLERDAIFSHHPEYVVAFAKTPCSMIRKGDYKLIHYFGDFLDPTGCVPKAHTLSGKFVLGSRTELYHLGKDPKEARNLAREMPEKTRELMLDLEAWWKETGARMPRPNPSMDRSQWIWNGPRDND